MYRWLISSILIILSIVTYAAPFHSKHYHFNVTPPSNWNIAIAKYQKSLIATLPELPATINVTGYRLENPVTANGFQKIRMGRKYDGWIHLLERPGTEFETQKANVETSYIAVYTKDLLNEQMETQKLLIGEYYFAMGDYVYTITVSTFQRHWPEVQSSLKAVLDSFWVGKGDRPIVKPPIIRPPSLSMSGYDTQNRNFVLASPNIQKNLTKQQLWTFPLSTPSLIHPVIMDDILVVAFPNQLKGISLRNFETQWAFSLPHKIISRLIAHHGLVTFVQAHHQTKDLLVSIDIQTGKIINTVKLNAPTSHPTLYQDQLIIAANDTVVALNARSSKLQWKKSLKSDPSFIPIIANDVVILASKSGKITALSLNKGAIKWSYHAQSPLKNNLLSSNGFLIVITPTLSNLDQVRAIDITTGKEKWQYTPLSLPFLVTHMPIADEAQLYLISDTQEDLSTVMALDLSSGELYWQTSVSKIRAQNRPIVLSDALLLLSTNQYWVIDVITGEFFKSKQYENSILDHYIYQDIVLQWQKNNRYYALALYK
jgi:hypothetical protein